MSDQGKIEKIHKLDTKHKTASIIKMMEGKHSDTEIICAALEALGDIADEDSLNEITHYLEHEDPAVRTKACCVAAKLNTDYLNTRVRYQMSQEKDPEVKKAIQEALDQRTEKAFCPANIQPTLVHTIRFNLVGISLINASRKL